MNSVLLEVAHGVASITLNEAATHNAFSASLLAGLHRALDEALERGDVNALLLRAQGKSFSAGGDLKALATQEQGSAAQVLAQARPAAELFKRLDKLPKPLIAAIDGAALGGGFGIACAAAITLASPRATFGCTELRVGLFPFLFMPALRKAAGDRQALELALSARVIDAATAQALGIVTRMTEQDSLDSDALALARRIAAFSPLALQLGLRAFHESSDMPVADAIELNLALRTDCYRSADAREGARAFIEKRTPEWTGV